MSNRAAEQAHAEIAPCSACFFSPIHPFSTPWHKAAMTSEVKSKQKQYSSAKVKVEQLMKEAMAALRAVEVELS